jgi:hypothetical protein
MKVMKNSILILCIISIAFLLFSCERIFRDFLDGGIDPYYKELILYADYNYPKNSMPSFIIDRAESSRAIKFIDNQSPKVLTIPDRFELVVPNVRFYDELGVYQVPDTRANNAENTRAIIAEKYINGKWTEDVEDNLKAKRSLNLQVVLVLDMSLSLGDDIQLVKNYAISAVERLLSRSSNGNNVEIGIILFAQNINKLDFTTNITTLRNFIGNATASSATKLYEGINTGIDLFYNSPKQPDARALILFTDGKNNSQSDAKFENANFVESRLRQPFGKDQGFITSYSIGLDGKQDGVDREVLKKLALNGGISEFTNSSIDLQKVFGRIIDNAASVWTLVYDRNNSPISNPEKLRFRILTTVL